MSQNADYEREGDFCEPCGFIHDGPICECGERLYAKGRGAPNLSRWQHVHTVGLTDHVPTPRTQIDSSGTEKA